MATGERKYDIVLFGATGYTGKYTAEHITKSLPTNLKWAVAGRSDLKLANVVEDIKKLNTDRLQPAIEVAQLTKIDLDALTQKTRVLLNTVGPYHLYGTQVVEACANNGTHYIDVTGETPWIKEMIAKYHGKARSSNAIIIPQNGTESAPADLLTFSLTSLLRKELSLSTKEVILSLHDNKGGLSGGTMTTILTMFDSYSLIALGKASGPQSLCPIEVSSTKSSSSLSTRLTGVRRVPDLGTLTTSLQGGTDLPIVYRTWGLLSPKYCNSETETFYGPNFTFSPYMTVRNSFVGTLAHVIISMLPFLLALPPVRWLIKRISYKAGEGPTREEAELESLEYRALGIPDWTETRKRGFARLRFEGSLYRLTGIFLAEAAMTILSDEATLVKKLGGGLLTPALLGDGYIERLANVGVKIETKILDY